MPKKLVLKLLLVSIFAVVSFNISVSDVQPQLKVYAGVTPPTTSSTLVPAVPDGDNGWYTVPVDITLDATDIESGVSEINYRIDGGSWVTTPFANTLNLAPNPSFEVYGAISPLNTNDWLLANPADTASFSRNNIEYPAGYATNSVEIGSTTPGWHAIHHQNAYAVATPFSNMSASALVKTQNADLAYFKVFAVSLDAFSQPVYTEIAQSNALSGTNAWTAINSNFVVNVADAIGVFLEIGVSGNGTAWIDAITLTEAITAAQVNLIIGSDGEHTLEYYSVDRVGNTEAINLVDIKIDQTPPSNWNNAGAFRSVSGGSEHELYVYVTVEDATSGLSSDSNKYQYHVTGETGFGFYENLLQCNTPWRQDEWRSLDTPFPNDGDNSAYLQTPKTDFCDSNWKICKTVRFYAKDMAGNEDTKDFCINGPWISFRGEGIVGTTTHVDMISEPEDDNTDGLIEMGGNTLTFFTSSRNWLITGYTAPFTYDYATFWDLTDPVKTDLTGNDLISASGLYYSSGDYEIDNQSTPNDYDTATFNQIVFVDGDLLIAQSIEVDDTSTAFFVVSGDVNIENGARDIGIAIHADGSINTAYDIQEGNSSQTLEAKGSFSADKINFQRTLQGANNNDVPSEEFTYEPKYVLKLKDFFEDGGIIWLGTD